jgi:predicted AlkP superfamily phosphohydrolase/phosphomutase
MAPGEGYTRWRMIEEHPAIKVFILGLDGATDDVLRPLIDAGEMPNLAALAATGVRGSLLSSVPPTSPVAWATFVTGKNPGKHGVYDFLEFSHDPLGGRVNTSRSVQGESIWEIVARAGLRSAAAGIALTWPPRKAAGFLIGDFLSPPGARDLSTDPVLLAEMERLIGPYEPWCTAAYHRGNEADVLRRLRAFLDHHLAAIRFLLGRGPWDLFAYNLMAVDRLLHELWHVFDEGHFFRKGRDLRAAREGFVDFFRAIDRAIGEIRAALPPDGALLVLSDHGNGAVTRYLNLNVWLLREGYIALRPGRRTALKRWLFERGKTPAWAYRRLARLGFADVVVKRLRGGQLGRLDRLADLLFLSRRDIDWGGTRAYAQGNYGQVFLNIEGRQPRGIVKPGGEAEALAGEIRSKLLALPDPESGLPLVAAVRGADEVYRGPLRPLAPDLLVEMRDPRHHTLGLFDFTTHKLLAKAFSMSGDHRPEGVLYAGGSGIDGGSVPRGATIADIAPTVLRLLGIPPPADMDGRVLEEILAPHLRGQVASGEDGGASSGAPSAASTAPALSPEEEAEVMRRLEDLGYL